MARKRTVKTVDHTFIEDAATIHRLLMKHMSSLRVDSEHYQALSKLNSHFVDVTKELHAGTLPWAHSTTGSPGPRR